MALLISDAAWATAQETLQTAGGTGGCLVGLWRRIEAQRAAQGGGRTRRRAWTG